MYPRAQLYIPATFVCEVLHVGENARVNIRSEALETAHQELTLVLQEGYIDRAWEAPVPILLHELSVGLSCIVVWPWHVARGEVVGWDPVKESVEVFMVDNGDETSVNLSQLFRPGTCCGLFPLLQFPCTVRGLAQVSHPNLRSVLENQCVGMLTATFHGFDQHGLPLITLINEDGEDIFNLVTGVITELDAANNSDATAATAVSSVSEMETSDAENASNRPEE